MNGFIQRFLPLFAACAVLAAAPAHAIDDRFDPSKYEKGGFAPVDNPAYAKECGSCHFTYLPGMLPARSWKALMARQNDHFGESLSLAPEAARAVEDYLTTHAADHSPYLGAQLMLTWLPDDSTPGRITTLPFMRQRHIVIRKMFGDPTMTVKKLTNCDSCHERASTGNFAYDNIVVPGVSKVIHPGGAF